MGSILLFCPGINAEQGSKMKTVYFQMMCGASGDMILSSLLDCGADSKSVSESLRKTGIEGLNISVEKVRRGAMICSHVAVSCAAQLSFRHLPQILEIISKGGYSKSVEEKAKQVFECLARAEALVHGIPVDKVHFHEIGAVDTIADVLGACLCMENLGIDRICFSDFNIGHGTIKAEHGIMPNPAPATAELIKGFRIAPLDINAEILTPTGAAILTGLGEQKSNIPAGKVLAIGLGCGDRQFEGFPNCLRSFIIEESGDDSKIGNNRDKICVLESDMDHISGEIMGFTAEEAMTAGALDVSWAPIFMKKGRPGYRLTLICRIEEMERMALLVISNTRTLGVRYRISERFAVNRESIKGSAGDEGMLYKKCSYQGVEFTKAEYESLAKEARKAGRPVIEMMNDKINTINSPMGKGYASTGSAT
jgi:uncharacterized protein (TIGR00299 family) protein